MIKIFSDPHIPNVEIFDNAVINFLKEKVLSSDKLIIAGDAFENFNCGVSNVSLYKYLGTRTEDSYILEGNHDFSEGKNALKIVNHFSDIVKIIEEYSFYDIGTVRFHFLNYFKTKIFPDFVFSDKHKNVLISHMDLNPEYPFKILEQFDLVVNGHEHNFKKVNNIVNIGSMRKTKSNEENTKYYIEMDENTFEYKFIPFETLTDIVKVFPSEIIDLVVTKPTVVKIYTSGLENRNQILEELFDKFGTTIIPQFEAYKDKDVESNIKNAISKDNSFDFNKLFDEYVDLYIKKFGVEEIDKPKLQELFSTKIKSVESEMVMENSDISINTIECENFRIFEKIDFDFNKFDDGITRIKGVNYDELKDGKPKSNGSGKSTLFEAVKYTLLGTESGINPLSYKADKGYSILRLVINGEKIEIKRTYNNKGKNDLHIKIDDVDFQPNDTNTDKMKMFKNKYASLYHSIKFILIDDDDFVKKFYTSTSGKEKMDIFKNIFNVINGVNIFVDNLKNEVSELSNDYKLMESNLTSIKTNRSNVAKSNLTLWKSLISNIEDTSKLVEENKELMTKLVEVKYSRTVLDNVKKYWEHNVDGELLFQTYYKTNKEWNYSQYFETENEILSLTRESTSLTSTIPNDVVDVKVDFEYDLDVIKKDKEALGFIDRVKNITKCDLDNSIVSKYNIKLNDLSTHQTQLKTITEDYKKLQAEMVKLTESKTSGKCNYCGSVKVSSEHIDKHIENQQLLLDGKMSEGKTKRALVETLKNELADIEKDFNKYNIFVSQLKENKLSESEYTKYVDYKLTYNMSDIELVLKYEENKKLIEAKKITLGKIKVIDDKIASLKILLVQYPDNFIGKINKDNINTFIEWDKYITNNYDYGLIDKVDELIENISNNTNIQNTINTNLSVIRTMEESNEKTKKSMSSLLKTTMETNNHVEFNNLKDKFNKLKDKYSPLKDLYTVLNSRSSLTFKEYFVNIFMSKFENVFNLLIKYLFNRPISIKFEDFDLKLFDGEIKTTYKNFSLGEKSNLKVCLLFTLNIIYMEYGIRTNMMSIDEFLDIGLDQASLENVLTLIDGVYKDVKVFIISHKNNMEEFYKNEVLVERRDGIAEVK